MTTPGPTTGTTAAPVTAVPGGRCFGDGNPLYEEYHDTEWGVPVHGEAALLERLALEGFQSGLSWLTVLRKRPAFRERFAGFQPGAVAAFTDDDVARLLEDTSIIRNRAKILAVVRNARAVVALHEAGETLDEIVWSAVPDPATHERPRLPSDVPGSTPGSVALARTLKSRGFSFVGPTTAYATMQACGVVDDHLVTCPVAQQGRAA